MLAKLLNAENLNQRESEVLFSEIVAGKLSEIEITAALLSLKFKAESAEEIAGAALALKKAAQEFPQTTLELSDSCGTGGDGYHTVNISTATSLVAAAMGIPMAKHGNRSVSSKCGSADLLEACGLNLNLSAASAAKMLEDVHFSFLFAPNYHQGVRHVMPVRKCLKTRTIFNLLGPLINPASPKTQLIGVYDEKLCYAMAETLRLLKVKRAMVVHGSGLDEIAIHGKTKVVFLDDQNISEFEIDPSEFGLPKYSIDDLKGGSPKENKVWLENFLGGKAKQAHTDAVAINLAAILYLNNREKSINAAFEQAKAQILSGKTYSYFNKIIEASNDLS